MLNNELKSKYLISDQASLEQAIQKLTQEAVSILFAVDDTGALVGSLTDGDIRRSLMSAAKDPLKQAIETAMNRNVKSISFEQYAQHGYKDFRAGVECIPVVDSAKHVQGLSFEPIERMCLGGRAIGEGLPTFLIAEIGNNHQGNLSDAKRLIEVAANSGFDCVKFQMRDLKQLYRAAGPKGASREDLATEYTLDLLSNFQLSKSDLFRAFDFAAEAGLVPLCTPWDTSALQDLEEYGLQGYKTASADLTNIEFLEVLAQTEKPLICSTGMSTEHEILLASGVLRLHRANHVFLHCNSTYPTPLKDVRLSYIQRLKRLTNSLVGYSGHERGYEVAAASVLLGASVIEKHITLDRSQEGQDHKVSLVPDECSRFVELVRSFETANGSSAQGRPVSQGELINRENLAKSLVAACQISPGEEIRDEMVVVRSPGAGLKPYRRSELLGKRSTRLIQPGDYFFETDIEQEVVTKKTYQFKRPYGIPVRYHDFEDLASMANLDFVEFHLSYSDLKQSINLDKTRTRALDFAVHCPELFSNDHILDLTADDDRYLHRSIDSIKRVISVCDELRSYFPKTKKPTLIVNAGGWSRSGFINEQRKSKKYQKLASVISSLDRANVSIAIQTMPPFPWHFGGQSFHNLFVCPNEINQFCLDNPSVKVCLDVSHSQMACAHYGWSLRNFIETVGGHVIHLHISDAEGVDGEGVQFGGGDIDLAEMGQILTECCPQVPFVPEIWQGHKNSGQGFWGALDVIEQNGNL